MWLGARSAYLLSGSAPSDWEHCIPRVGIVHYVITFCNLREDE